MTRRELPTVSLRIKAGEMLMGGDDVVRVARALGLSENTVRKYRAIIDREGMAGLRALSLGGRRSALDDDARARLSQALARRPQDVGLDNGRWTIGAVGQLIQREFGITFSRVYVRQLIIHLGFGDQLRATRFSSMPGKPPRLAPEGFAWLVAVVEQSPRTCGIDADGWTNARLRLAIEGRYGVKYSHSHMWKILSQLGLSHLASRSTRSPGDR